MTSNRHLSRAIKLILTAIIIYFVYRQVADKWPAIEAHDWQIHWGWLGVSVLTALLTFGVLAALWQRIIRGFNHRLNLAESFRLFYLSNLGRYVPGKVWQLFGILYLAKQKNVPAAHATASFVAVQLFAIPASFLVFAATLWLEPILLDTVAADFPMTLIYLFLVAMVLISLAIILFPEKLFILGDKLLKRFNKGDLAFRLSRTEALLLYLGYIIAWTLYGVTFWFFLKSVAGTANFPLIAAVGAFNGAYQIGYLALFAPSGLGPREFILTVLLTPFIGPIAPAVAILARLWSLLVESIAALVALAVGK